MWGGTFFLELGAAKYALFSRVGRGKKVKKTRAKRALMRQFETGTVHICTYPVLHIADSRIRRVLDERLQHAIALVPSSPEGQRLCVVE